MYELAFFGDCSADDDLAELALFCGEVLFEARSAGCALVDDVPEPVMFGGGMIGCSDSAVWLRSTG